MKSVGKPEQRRSRGLMPYRFYTVLFWLIAVWLVIVSAGAFGHLYLHWYRTAVTIDGIAFGLLFMGAIAAYRMGGVKGRQWALVLPLPVMCGGIMLVAFGCVASTMFYDWGSRQFDDASPILVRATGLMRVIKRAAIENHDRFPDGLPPGASKYFSAA